MADDKQQRVKNLAELLNFVENAPANDEIIAMDCNDHCEQIASFAEKVADGAKLEDILPELQEHMKYWGDCREEFIALVAVLKAEVQDDLPVFEEVAE